MLTSQQAGRPVIASLQLRSTRNTGPYEWVNQPRGATQVYWCTHAWTYISKVPLKQVFSFLPDNTHKQAFCDMFHINFDPQNMPDLYNTPLFPQNQCSDLKCDMRVMYSTEKKKKKDRNVAWGRLGGAWASSVRSPAPLRPPNEMTLCTGVFGEPPFWVPVRFPSPLPPPPQVWLAFQEKSWK